MTTLLLDNKTSSLIKDIKLILPKITIFDKNISEFQQALLSLSHNHKSALDYINKIVKNLLIENGYVYIKGLEADDSIKSILMFGLGIGEVFADLSHQETIVCETKPRPDERLQGNQLKPLFLHTDFAMLENPPIATIIECKKQDPSGLSYGSNGLSIAQDIVSKYYGTKKLDLILNTYLPFGGTTPEGKDILIHKPILELTAGRVKIVRFHPSRIHHGFRLRNTDISNVEYDVLSIFQEWALQSRRKFSLDLGELLIVNNRTALHDRSACSLKINSDLTLESRISHVLFVNEFHQ